MYDLLKIKLALSICTSDNECQMAFYNVKMAFKRQIGISEAIEIWAFFVETATLVN